MSHTFHLFLPYFLYWLRSPKLTLILGRSRLRVGFVCHIEQLIENLKHLLRAAMTVLSSPNLKQFAPPNSLAPAKTWGDFV